MTKMKETAVKQIGIQNLPTQNILNEEIHT